LDGCLDFNLLEGFRNAFAFRDWKADQFSSFLTRHEDYFPESFSRPSFLDNHDMNRFLWAAGGDLRSLRLAALCQFTLSGAPVIYYGTEVGLSQERDVRQNGRGLPEEARLPMRWGRDQNLELWHYYRSLIKTREKHPVLRQGKANVIQVDKNVLVYQRGYLNRLFVALNLSDDMQQICLNQKIRSVLIKTGESKIHKDEMSLTLSPMSGAILTSS
jgi:glycosidase